jgi:hypothetical protein
MAPERMPQRNEPQMRMHLGFDVDALSGRGVGGWGSHPDASIWVAQHFAQLKLTLGTVIYP